MTGCIGMDDGDAWWAVGSIAWNWWGNGDRLGQGYRKGDT